MTKNLLALLMAAGLSGCAGVSITPISTTQAGNAHKTPTEIKGYIVYAPVVVVEVSAKAICVKDKNDKCETKLVCGAGTPFVLPDYSKPYVVHTTSGLGKAAVEIGLKDGWQITNIKDSSDNTALLGFIEKLVLAEKTLQPAGPSACPVAGLYRVNLENNQIKLQKLQSYTQ